MKKILLTTRLRRTATLISLTTITVVLVAGAATGAYSGKTHSGDILTCFSRSDGAVRIVDHLPCKKGETALRWNSSGPIGKPGQSGKDGRDGTDGQAGAAGERGADGARGTDGAKGPAGPAGPSGAGQAGPAGQDGKDGAAGAPGAQGPTGAGGETGARSDTGPQGPAGTDGNDGQAGADGARGTDGATGPAGAQGPAGPQGPAGSDAGSSMQFGQVINNSDPDCAMVGPVGRTTGAACNFGAIQQVGEYLPSSAVIHGFRVLLDQTVNAPTDIIARSIDPATSASVDAFAVCTVPAGSNTCTQTGERTLTGPNLFAFQFSGDRAWNKARFGYTLVRG